jgi:hypothetical protein
LERVEIEQLACCAPAGIGLQMTHWSTRSWDSQLSGGIDRASGKMRGWCLPANDSYQLCRVLPRFFYKYREARRIHLIWDGGPSHISEYTQEFLRLYRPQVRVSVTPAHASWLNQAELLLRSFASHYLDRGDWSSKEQMIDHLNASCLNTIACLLILFRGLGRDVICITGLKN